jgi:long-subunit acyl-CoA synthetase (AMP-forming)
MLVPGMSKRVHEVFESTVKQHAQEPAFRRKKGAGWETITWAQHADITRRLAKGFLRLGLEPGRGVSIIGFNCHEWVAADLAAILAGGVPAGIYTTNSKEQVRYIAHHSESQIAVVEDPDQALKFLQVRDQLPHLRAIVQMHGTPVDERVLSFEHVLKLGDQVADADLAKRTDAQRVDDMATLIYTSGTTGDPKAVMITHENLTWTAESLSAALAFSSADVLVSYLPLSHIAEQMLTIHGPMRVGAVVGFAESLEKLPEALVAVRPTIFLGVPRVWEKIQAKLQGGVAQASPVKKKLFAWASRTGLRAGYAAQDGTRKPTLEPLADRLVFSKLRQRLGLDRARVCVTSAAPISKPTLEFFLGLGISLLEVYGMSECTGPATYSPPDNYRTGKAGIVIPGAELKIAEDGEVCMRGKHVFRGYLKDPEATRAAIDDEGWLHSGDIGTIDAQGFLQITDRKKDLLITAGGENIAPQVIEGLLKGIPGVAHAVVLGDRQKYLAALLTLDPERVPELAKTLGSPARSVSQAATCPLFRSHMAAAIEATNQSLARVQTIKKFEILPTEFGIPGGELTPTMKLRRKVIGEKYKKEIAALYDGV